MSASAMPDRHEAGNLLFDGMHAASASAESNTIVLMKDMCRHHSNVETQAASWVRTSAVAALSTTATSAAALSTPVLSPTPPVTNEIAVSPRSAVTGDAAGSVLLSGSAALVARAMLSSSAAAAAGESAVGKEGSAVQRRSRIALRSRKETTCAAAISVARQG